MKVISTKDSREEGVKLLMYGESGAGKTSLIKTAKNPLIISSEKGMLTLADVDIPVIEIATEKDLDEAFAFAVKSEYDTICLDSLSDIAETLLISYKEKLTDGRAAYGRLNDVMGKHIRKFRDISGKHVYFTAKEALVEANGVTVARPMMPGQTLTNNLPYFYDCVLRLTFDKKGNRTVHTASSYSQVAKDRSNKLDKTEEANLSHIIKKIVGE